MRKEERNGLTPSKVSTKLSSTRRVLARTMKIVLLSLRTSNRVLTAANGPLKRAKIAA